jgi:hypothetical protein
MGSSNVVSVYKPIASEGRRKSNHELFLWDLSKVQRVVSSLLGLISYTRTRAKAPVKCKTTLCDVSGLQVHDKCHVPVSPHRIKNERSSSTAPPPKESLGLYRNINCFGIGFAIPQATLQTLHFPHIPMEMAWVATRPARRPPDNNSPS